MSFVNTGLMFRVAEAQAWANRLAGGWLRVYGSAYPGSPAAAPSGPALLSAAVTAGTVNTDDGTLAIAFPSVQLVQTGAPMWARFVTSDGNDALLDVSAAGPGGDPSAIVQLDYDLLRAGGFVLPFTVTLD